MKVVKLCKFKGVSSNGSPAVLRETHRDVRPDILAVQHARGEPALEEKQMHPLKTYANDSLRSVS